jgi:hypothetical protein
MLLAAFGGAMQCDACRVVRCVVDEDGTAVASAEFGVFAVQWAETVVHSRAV